jgi:hypothetical protein
MNETIEKACECEYTGLTRVVHVDPVGFIILATLVAALIVFITIFVVNVIKEYYKQ